MKWIKIKIESGPESLAEAVGIFEDAGLSSLEIEDSREFLESLESSKGRWDFVDEALYEEKSKACSVAAYVPDAEAGRRALEAIEDKARGSFAVCFAVVDEEDWAESWKKYFKPIPVGKNILICPVWEAVPERYNSRTVFKIDPGMSFGTGMHETTRLCAAALERHVKAGSRVLDLGCGSGILSVIAAMLGAAECVAADIDENSAKVAGENAKLNGVAPDKYRAYAGDLLVDKALRGKLAAQKYDLVLANIVPEVIIALLPFVKDVLKEGGVAVLSGIIGRYLPQVEEAAASLGFGVIAGTRENDWQCLEVVKT
jgi:ribosomal protein L11 methyltransferase